MCPLGQDTSMSWHEARNSAHLGDIAAGRVVKANMANTTTHWLKSWTLPQHAGYWEETLKQNMGRSPSSPSPILSCTEDGRSTWKCEMETFLGPRVQAVSGTSVPWVELPLLNHLE